jgi:hypothetical protein
MSRPPIPSVTETRTPSVPYPSLPPSFLLPWLLSAGVVLVSRFFHAADLAYDTTIQFQAAQNLLAGNGLAVYTPTTDDLGDPLALETLTHFPSGFSLCAAALMALGAGPGTVIKVLGATAMMLGWWGWARLAFAYMEDGWRQKGLWRWVAFTIAFLTPLLFTLPWGGTDIFEWAAVPWVLILVVRSQFVQAQGELRFDVLAGALTGFCVLMRYASLFLAGFVYLAIGCQCRMRPRSLFRREMAFSAGLLPFLAVQAAVNTVFASRPASPGGITVDVGILTILERGWDGLFHLATIYAPVFFWLPSRRMEELMDGSFGVALAVIVFLSPVMLAKATHGRLTLEIWHDVRIVAVCLFVFLPVFLLVCEMMSTYDFALDRRHYMPLVPLAVLAAYWVAQGHRSSRSRLVAIIRLASRGYLAGFLLVAIIGMFLLVSPGARGQFRRMMVLGTSELQPWPSMRTTYEFSHARDYVLSVMKAAPDAHLITNYPHWFFAESAVDRSRVKRFERCDSVWVARVTGPVRLLIFAADLGGPLQEMYWSESLVEPTRADCYERLPPVDLVRRFPDERSKLLQVEIPAGVTIPLKAAAVPLLERRSESIP